MRLSLAPVLLVAGRNWKAVSALRPLARESASSILVSRALAVFQVWVRVRPVRRYTISKLICWARKTLKSRWCRLLRANIPMGPITTSKDTGADAGFSLDFDFDFDFDFETFRSAWLSAEEAEVDLPSDLSEYLPSSYISKAMISSVSAEPS